MRATLKDGRRKDGQAEADDADLQKEMGSEWKAATDGVRPFVSSTLHA